MDIGLGVDVYVDIDVYACVDTDIDADMDIDMETDTDTYGYEDREIAMYAVLLMFMMYTTNNPRIYKEYTTPRIKRHIEHEKSPLMRRRDWPHENR